MSFTTNPKRCPVAIFDSTLRDGQQCPGAGMSFEKNVEYAHLAAELRVDVLEAGFPAASRLDYEIVHCIADELKDRPDGPVIAALCQLRAEQIDATIEALLPAVSRSKARLHVYVPVDPHLMSASLGDRALDKAGMVRDLRDFVERAKKEGLEVEFSPEGYSRMEANFGFVTDLIRAAVSSGASVINCPDTIGGASRLEGKQYFVEKMNEHAAMVAREFPEKHITWSVHCHNDFGLAVDNSVQAVFYGPARQIECCINGVGERAGNAALEQCVMILRCFDAERRFDVRTDTSKLQKVSDFVKKHMLPRQPHYPIVGDNAMKHSAGGHTNAIIKNQLAYQPFDPKVVGRKVGIVFGPLSGGNHAKAIIEQAGYRCDDSEKAHLAQFIKDLYRERRKGITDDELLDGYFDYRKPIDIEKFDYWKEADHARVMLHGRFFDQEGEITRQHHGDDSALVALKGLIDTKFPGYEIESYRSQSEGAGASAHSHSIIVLVGPTGEFIKGEGSDQDIEISAMKALIDATNRAYIECKYRIGGAIPA